MLHDGWHTLNTDASDVGRKNARMEMKLVFVLSAFITPVEKTNKIERRRQ